MNYLQNDLLKRVNPVIPGYPRVIGSVQVNNPIWLAPLAGITFSSLRRFYRSLGAGLVHTEMVSALGLCYKGRKTKELLYGYDDEKPVVLQLFGSEAADIAKGAEIALEIRKFDAIQVNMACPMPKVTKKGSGSKLLETPDKAAAMMTELKKFGLPAWAKIRIIPEESEISTVAFCDRLINAGCDYIFVHGRTRAQRYEGTASRSKVAEIASAFPGMIGGSGDCYTPEDFEDYLSCGCTAVLAARGILRDIFMIPRTLKAMGGDISDTYVNPDEETQAALLLDLGRTICANEGEPLAIVIARRMMASLFKGFPGAAKLRRNGAMLKTWHEMEELIINSKGLLNDPEEK